MTETGPRYSPTSLVNYLIHREKQDGYFIFVEDHNIDGLYDRLFTKLNSHLQFIILNSVKLAGMIMGYDNQGKEALIGILRLIDDNTEPGVKLPIKILLDPDFQLSLKQPPLIRDDRIIYLERYCIENYIIDKSTIILTIQSLNLKMTKVEAEQLIEYEKWLETIDDDFYTLICYFALNQKHFLETNQSLVLRSEHSMKDVNAFFEINSHIINKSKLNEYHSTMHEKLKTTNVSDPRKQIKEFSESFKKILESDPIKYICGKYLYHSLYHFLRNDRGLDIPKDGRIFLHNLFIQMVDNRSQHLLEFIQTHFPMNIS